jgi:3-hydroxyacyl-CoA dehydrogenase/enoyl-CoA hydratase/3-hydroxybutyryl-CoA epimerase
MMSERIALPLIENVGRMTGMPMGPLEVMDSIGIDTALKITRQTRKEVAKSDKPDATEEIMAWMVGRSGRPGIKAGKFYDYDSSGSGAHLTARAVRLRQKAVSAMPPRKN